MNLKFIIILSCSIFSFSYFTHAVGFTDSINSKSSTKKACESQILISKKNCGKCYYKIEADFKTYNRTAKDFGMKESKEISSCYICASYPSNSVAFKEETCVSIETNGANTCSEILKTSKQKKEKANELYKKALDKKYHQLEKKQEKLNARLKKKHRQPSSQITDDELKVITEILKSIETKIPKNKSIDIIFLKSDSKSCATIAVASKGVTSMKNGRVISGIDDPKTKKIKEICKQYYYKKHHEELENQITKLNKELKKLEEIQDLQKQGEEFLVTTKEIHKKIVKDQKQLAEISHQIDTTTKNVISNLKEQSQKLKNKINIINTQCFFNMNNAENNKLDRIAEKLTTAFPQHNSSNSSNSSSKSKSSSTAR